jgi:hypothetical protein
MVVVVIFVISNIFYNFLRLRDANRNRQRWYILKILNKIKIYIINE